MLVSKLKTKKLTKVCMVITNGICKCWKFFRTATPFRNVQDFDFHVSDLRCQYPNALSYQHFKKKNKKLFDRADLNTIVNSTSLEVGFISITIPSPKAS